jgi:hypothetical protein
MNEVGMNGVSQSGRHFYRGIGAVVELTYCLLTLLALHHGVHSPQRSGTAIIADSRTKASDYDHRQSPTYTNG